MSRAEEWACLHLWPESIPPNQQWHEGDYHQKTASWRGPSPAAISKATVLHKYWPVLMARGRVRAKWMVSSPVLIKHQPALLIRNFFFFAFHPQAPSKVYPSGASVTTTRCPVQVITHTSGEKKAHLVLHLILSFPSRVVLQYRVQRVSVP